METVVGLVLEIVKCFGAPVCRRIGYVKNLKKNFKKLNTEAEMLYAMRCDKQTEVDRFSPRKVRSSQFEGWVKEVEQIENQTNAIEEDFKQEKKCFRGCCSCMKLGKDMVDLIDRISELNKFDGPVMIDAPPRIVEEMPVQRIDAKTSIDTLRKVVGFLEDPGMKRVGIWGMGGIGKTMLMKNINSLPEIAHMFNIVIWVTVSRDWSLRMVQKEVAQRLSLDLPDGMSDDGVSRMLYDRLRNNKYLLLLDDVWERLNLEEVGIPIPNEENGCKILLTTRDLQICHKMETNKQISVEVLSDEEAWELFHGKVGSVLVDTPEIHELAREVVKECKGLPLAIIVVGGALREEGDVRVWRNALRELGSAATSQIKDMEEAVFKRLRFSYDRLKGDRQRCFLYGALYPEDAEIVVAELIEYWRAAGFLEDDGTMENLAEAVDAGHAILKDLVDASLLERCRDYDDRQMRVKMHDVIRDLALRITSIEATGGGNSNKYKFLVRAGKGIQTPPGEEQWKECNAVSLMRNELKWLPERPACPLLSTLLLQGNRDLKHIPESFFKDMPALQVLDLSGTRIRSLPPSICNLVHLRGMYLNDCWKLGELPPEIGAVKALEVLQIGGGTTIRGLQITVGELTRLKCLHVVLSRAGGYGEMMMMIPQGIVSRLSMLEDLRIEVSGDERIERDWDRNLEYVMEEFCNLTELTHLKFWFTEVGYLQRFIEQSAAWQNGKLSSFTFQVGPPGGDVFYARPPVGRILQFVDGDGAPPQAIKQVLCRAECFSLWRHSSIKDLLREFGVENMTRLKHLEVKECPGIENLLIDRNCSFPNLEQLHLDQMENLRDICEDQLVGMVNLRVLELFRCGRLQKVLPRSQSIIQLLPNLEELRVYTCNKMKEIIEGEGGAVVEGINNALPKLKTLVLRGLRNLEIICKQILAWPSIERIVIDDCRNLRSLPFGIHNNTSTLRRSSAAERGGMHCNGKMMKSKPNFSLLHHSVNKF